MDNKWSLKDEIVVSGMSGRYPESDNVEEFANNLYSGTDMVVEDERRWPYGFLGLPKGSGKLKDISKFDAKFFGFSESEANLMDSQLRIMTELTYEAIWDSGNDPNHLSGTRTGTFIGNCFDEAASAQGEDYSKVVGYRQLYATRIAQLFNFNGPSVLLDTACASSFCALHEAIRALRSQLCERAVVIGVNMCMRPSTQLQFHRLNMMSPDGHCKCLDSEANGYAKGEACVAVLLETKSQSKRIYATVVHSNTNTDGFKELGITYPSSIAQAELMRRTYAEAGINPIDIKYVEAHCTGTQAGDPVEMAAIVDAMCTGRTEPLLIGALKSNIGHSEASSGLCSLTKVILSFENQCIPPNLHMTVPNPKIEGLVTGILKPITKNTPFFDNWAGLNCFGFGGVNVHVIVRADSKLPSIQNNDIFGNIPRLVLMCGRNEEALNHTFTRIINNPKMLTRDYLSLINDISKTSPFKNSRNGFKGMKCRGFTLLDKNDDKNNIESEIIQLRKVPKTKPQIWYVLSGMGSQWPAMANTLMDIEVFAQSIRASAEVLNEYGIDLLSLLLENDENLIRCPLNAFISLAAIQIALVDVLNALDITPDGIVGHSIGELVCAYVDQCISAEETIRMAYWRGKCVKDELNTRGTMAAVGLSLAEVQTRCPDGVFAACHNSDDSVTVSGDNNAVNSFVNQLNADNVFARRVDSTGIAFHSPLMSAIRDPLIAKLKSIIPTERLRSSKWKSSTYEESDPKSKYISAEYFADNLILPVLFADALTNIPHNAVVVEVSAHHLLQPILKKSLGFDITYIPLMKKNGDNIRFLLQSIGKLYTTGANPAIETLYPRVEYPVSRGTPTISPLVEWNHKKSYIVYQYPNHFNPIGSTDFVVKVDLQDKEDSYLADHCIDGRVLFPATGYLLLVWKHLAKGLGVSYEDLAVEFENVRLLRATILPKVGITKFDIRILETNGEFVISESGSVAATGRIFLPQKPFNRFEYLLTEELMKNKQFFDENNELILNTKDIYKELRLRGYDYGNGFQCLSKAVISCDRLKAGIKWTNNWVTFADNLIQMAILGKSSRGLYLPVRIDSLRCDARALAVEAKRIGSEEPEFAAIFDNHLGIGVSKGLEFRGIKANLAPRRVSAQVPVIENYRFVPYNEVCAPTREDNTVLHQYVNQCNALAVRVAKKYNICLESLQTNREQVMKALEDSEHWANDGCDSTETENHFLLQLLIDMNCLKNNRFDDKLLEQMNEKVLNLDKDLLNQYFIKEYFIRSLMETVLENMNSNTNSLDVLEVSQSTGIIAQSAIKVIGLTALNIKVNYRLLHTTVHQLSNECINDIECHKWIVEKSRLPPDLNGLDLILFEDKFNYVLGSDMTFNTNIFFESVFNAIKENGFLIVFIKNQLTFAEEVVTKVLDFCGNNFVYQLLSKRYNQIISEAEKVGFSFISTKVDSISKKSIIFRKITANIRKENQTFIDITEDKCELWIEKLQNSLKTIDKRPETENLWLLAKDSPTNGIIGFVKCLRKEPNGHRIRCIFNYKLNANDIEMDFNSDFLETIVKKNLIYNVLSSDQELGSFRHLTLDLRSNTVPAEHCYLNVQTRGDLSSFGWFEAQHKYWPLGRKTSEMLCQVYYSALNFRDIMLATGKLVADALPDDMALQDCILGLEFSGRDENGNRVMGMIATKGLATTVVMPDMDFVWPIPQHWSMEEASTVPVVYATAYYALIIRGKLRERESVLIHSGSGGVGQAAIAICLSLDCQLFVTCGSDTKRQFLKNEFPKLCDKNFWTSRDSSFESFIMNETDGRGVDLVLNSLSEEKLQASVRCLATNGRFLEIGKFDLSENNDLGLSMVMRNKTFHGILLDSLFVDNSKSSSVLRRHKAMVRQLIENGISDGTVRPLKRTVFECSQVEQAFRFMASGRHIGKVVLKVRDEETDPKNPSMDCVVKYESIARTVFKPNKCYVIIGGLGGFGLELANWLIERGAIHLVLTSRSGFKDMYQRFRIKYFQSLGINVQISTKDVTKVTETRELICLANSLTEGVGGVFNLAMDLADGLFENQTVEMFEKVLLPKAQVIHNLDQISRELCPQLDYFVCFSSVSCGRGNSGQSNYGFANSVMERVCEVRRAQGLHGLAVQWGAVGDVGFVADYLGGNETTIGGTLPQRMPSCLATLDRILQMDSCVVLSAVKADNKMESNHKKGNLLKTIAHILGIEDYLGLNSNTTLTELGMDSLMTVEVKQLLERDYDLVLSVQDIRHLSVGGIATIGQQNQIKSKSIETQNQKLLLNEFEFEIPFESITYLNEVLDGKPVILLPPLEGSFTQLTQLAKDINRPVIGINWTNDCKDLKTIEETAQHFLNVIRDKLKSFGDNYDLMGYSFGGCVAYEMALQLQTMSTKKVNQRVILLDSSPLQFAIYANHVIEKYGLIDAKSQELETLLLFLNLYVSIDNQKVKQMLEKTENSERVVKVSQIFLESQGIEINSQNIEFIAKTFSNKLLMLNIYRVNGLLLDNNLLLIRAKDVIISNEELIKYDYGLSEIISGKVETFAFNGNHRTFLSNNINEITSLINNYLK